MATYVLLHGADNTGRLWDKVAPLLREQGHSVFCPTMSPIETSTLGSNIGEACSVLEGAALAEVILVGHSYAAFVATGVADRVPQLIRNLVYLDSAIPENGKSLFDMLFEVYGLDKTKFDLQPHQPCVDKIEFDEKQILRIPKTYIFCQRSLFADATRQALQTAMDAPEKTNWSYLELDATHTAMVAQPRHLAKLLMGLP